MITKIILWALFIPVLVAQTDTQPFVDRMSVVYPSDPACHKPDAVIMADSTAPYGYRCVSPPGGKEIKCVTVASNGKLVYDVECAAREYPKSCPPGQTWLVEQGPVSTVFKCAPVKAPISTDFIGTAVHPWFYAIEPVPSEMYIANTPEQSASDTLAHLIYLLSQAWALREEADKLEAMAKRVVYGGFKTPQEVKKP